MKISAAYYSELERELIIKQKNHEGLYLVGEDLVGTPKYLIFDSENPTTIEELHQKLAEQEVIIQELIFEIIPSLGGM